MISLIAGLIPQSSLQAHLRYFVACPTHPQLPNGYTCLYHLINDMCTIQSFNHGTIKSPYHGDTLDGKVIVIHTITCIFSSWKHGPHASIHRLQQLLVYISALQSRSVCHIFLVFLISMSQEAFLCSLLKHPLPGVPAASLVNEGSHLCLLAVAVELFQIECLSYSVSRQNSLWGASALHRGDS